MLENLTIKPTQPELSFLDKDYINNIESKLPCFLFSHDKFDKQTFACLLCSYSKKLYAVPFIGDNKFQWYFVDNTNHSHIGGIIFPNVNVEIFTEHFELIDGSVNFAPGSLIWEGSQLNIVVHKPNKPGILKFNLQNDLKGFGKIRATFPKWQITIGEGKEKKILWKVDVRNTNN